MGDDSLYIGEFEELVLRAVSRLGTKAYGLAVRDVLTEAGRKASIGAVYATLDRLQDKGLVTSRQGEKSEERSGRTKIYFEITGPAMSALEAAELTRRRVAPNLHLGLINPGSIS